MIADPFSEIAATYDREFSSLPGVAEIRERMIRAARGAFPPGARVLDLGCGTGEDAVALARAGYRVTAGDSSPAMMALAAQRARDAGIPLDVRRIDAGHMEKLAAGSFDAIYSNFGALNLLGALRGFFGESHRLLSPGGAVLICLFGRTSPWEIASFLSRGLPARAFRRLRPGAVNVPLGGTLLPVFYFASASVIAQARPWFDFVRSWGINVISPPPSSEGLSHRFPRVAAALRRAEARVAGLYPLSRGGDHVAFLFRRRP